MKPDFDNEWSERVNMVAIIGFFEQLYHPNMATHAWILKIKDHWKVLCKKLGIKNPERIKTKKTWKE